MRHLRICCIAETVHCGVGRHLVDLIEGMVGRGHEVHLLHSIDRADPSLLRKIERLPGARCEAFAMRREPHWSDIGILYALARYLRRWGPFDVIHGHSSKGGAYGRLLTPFVPGKCLYSPHAFVTMSPRLTAFQRSVYRCAERGLSRLSDNVLCVSEDEWRHALGLGIQTDKLRLVPPGLSPRGNHLRMSASEHLGVAVDTILIGFVGRLDEQKAPELVVEAASRIIERRRKIHVVVIGDGPLRNDLVALARRLRIADAFSWLGEAPARGWLPALDVLAMPSRYEGFSYLLLEALDAGLPVVCTPVGGVSEAIEDGVNGFVVPHEDVEALANRLTQLVDDPNLRAAMGLRARQRSARFSLPRMIDRTEEIYLS